jgi:hypothetical protein
MGGDSCVVCTTNLYHKLAILDVNDGEMIKERGSLELSESMIGQQNDCTYDMRSIELSFYK